MTEEAVKKVGEELRRRHILLMETCQKVTQENEMLKKQLMELRGEKFDSSEESSQTVEYVRSIQMEKTSLIAEVEALKLGRESQKRMMESLEFQLHSEKAKTKALEGKNDMLEKKLAAVETQLQSYGTLQSRQDMEGEINALRTRGQGMDGEIQSLQNHIKSLEVEFMKATSFAQDVSKFVVDFRETVGAFLDHYETFKTYDWKWDNQTAVNIIQSFVPEDRHKGIHCLAIDCHDLLNCVSGLLHYVVHEREGLSQQKQEKGCQVSLQDDSGAISRDQANAIRAAKSQAEGELQRARDRLNELKAEYDALCEHNRYQGIRIVNLEAEIQRMIGEKKTSDRTGSFFEEYIELKREVAKLRQSTESSSRLKIPRPRPPNQPPPSANTSENDYTTTMTEITPRPLSQDQDMKKAASPQTSRLMSITRIGVAPPPMQAKTLPVLPSVKR
eukprot:TRINITY_DN6523_c0_g1_i8.p1 TRINITY_DN6523_c0_g1~~TRINITY_DN6523_c0_g1_i8.p1  ORF type:complete len:445 (+),score=106.23 TRINITY_DN6523_c0_g1_i8:80-1414(+)